jgi:hypothetical protein
MSRKRFTSEKNAQSFAKKVNGQVNDLRGIEEAKSNFTVTYEKTDKTRAHGSNMSEDRCPEEGRDFGCPNEYWQ